jgi:hypothetical protein
MTTPNAPPLTTEPLCPECTATVGHDDACPVPLREARNQRNEANIAAEAFATDRDRIARENAELRSRIATLEAALRDIRYELTPPVDRKSWTPLRAVDKAEAIARAALAGGGGA